MSSSNPPRVACIGGGYWGPNLVRNTERLGALAMICDRDPVTLAKLSQSHPDVPVTLDAGEVFADPSIDAVVIATPASTHHRLALEAMRAGKDVFVEKPLALTAAEAEELAAEADRLERVLMVGHILEYHPAYECLLKLARDGELGTIKHVRSSRLSLGKLRHEENVMWSFAPHDVSLVLGLVAPHEPKRVEAFGTTVLQPGIPDTVHMDLGFADGVTAHIHVSWLEPVKLHQLTVIGTRAMAVFEDSRPDHKLLVYDRGFDRVEDSWLLRRGDERVIDVPPGEPMARELAHFLSCVASRRRPKSDGWSGARVLRVLEAAQHKLQSPAIVG